MDTNRAQAGKERTGYTIGDRVDVMAGSNEPMASGIVCGYGAAKMNPNGVRIRFSPRRVETWPKSLIRKSPTK